MSGSDAGGTAARGSSKSKKKYEFRRGEPGKPEDSWTAIQRLAEEVRWHAFERYAETVIAVRPVRTIARGDSAVATPVAFFVE